MRRSMANIKAEMAARDIGRVHGSRKQNKNRDTKGDHWDISRGRSFVVLGA
jgi:hypothetical protein